MEDLIADASKNDMVKSTTEDTGTMTEMTTKNKDKIQMTYDLNHDRTKCNIKTTTFVWSIDNFWNIYTFYDTLISSSIEGQHFKLQMKIDKEKDKLSFSIYPSDNNSKADINIKRYSVFIQNVTKPSTNWNIFCSNTDSLYDVCLETLRPKKSIFLSNTTLSICFRFESYENILRSITHKNILETKSLITVLNDPTCDDKSNALVTFVINEQTLSVRRSSLVRANSTVFNHMLKLFDTEEISKNGIQITDINVTYDIFQHVISYLESGSLFDLEFNVDDFSNSHKNKDYNNTIQDCNRKLFCDLLAAANEFNIKDLKLLCEKHLIKCTVNDNVIKHLNIAITNNAVHLENYVKRFIKLHLNDIRNTSEFAEIDIINPDILLEILKQELLEENASYSENNDNNCNIRKKSN